ncbi:TIGR03749 family integrating conjugative element protein [Azotobacter vinelandii]|uniref:TIGR03749 family integrating conjugative element protein n=1 Tax=Azotobacter vinelandii TaxID=354 RepID=UPI0009E87385|nr:TIGR03749 family integrating conjugative element protein [Azotobacter vinelandii]
MIDSIESFTPRRGLCACALGALGLLSLGLPSSAAATEILAWDRTPLAIDLPVGKERLVTLERNVSVGLPGAIAKPEVLRVQSTGGVLYLKANQAFDTQRVQLRDEATGELILVDLTAKAQASDEPIKVVVPQADDGSDAAEEEAVSEAEAEKTPVYPAPLPVVLTRYAAQSLYAPLRAIEPVEGVQRVAMRLPATLDLLPALPVLAEPIAAWSLGGFQATAVRLRNRDPQRSFELDPRYLQGSLAAATFMHTTLGPKGRLDDSTTVIVVTRGPLVERLLLPRPQPTVDPVRDEGV